MRLTFTYFENIKNKMEQDAIVRIIYHMKKYTKKRKAKRKAKKAGKGKKGKWGKAKVIAKVAGAAKAMGGGDTPRVSIKATAKAPAKDSGDKQGNENAEVAEVVEEAEPDKEIADEDVEAVIEQPERDIFDSIED